MGSITLSDGTTSLTLHVDQELPYTDSPNVIEHIIPERAGSIMQYLGRKSSLISIDGYTQTSTDVTTLIDWAKNGTQLTYTDTLDVAYNSATTVIIVGDIIRKRIGGRPEGYFRYMFTLKEFSQ